MSRSNRQSDCQNRQDASCILPVGTPAWITPELVEATIRTWQPYYREVITAEVAVEMIRSVGQLYEALSESRTNTTTVPHDLD